MAAPIREKVRRQPRTVALHRGGGVRRGLHVLPAGRDIHDSLSDCAVHAFARLLEKKEGDESISCDLARRAFMCIFGRLTDTLAASPRRCHAWPVASPARVIRLDVHPPIRTADRYEFHCTIAGRPLTPATAARRVRALAGGWLSPFRDHLRFGFRAVNFRIAHHDIWDSVFPLMFLTRESAGRCSTADMTPRPSVSTTRSLSRYARSTCGGRPPWASTSRSKPTRSSAHTASLEPDSITFAAARRAACCSGCSANSAGRRASPQEARATHRPICRRWKYRSRSGAPSPNG